MADLPELRRLLWLVEHQPASAKRDQLAADIRHRIVQREVGDDDEYERAVDQFQGMHIDHRSTPARRALRR